MTKANRNEVSNCLLLSCGGCGASKIITEMTNSVLQRCLKGLFRSGYRRGFCSFSCGRERTSPWMGIWVLVLVLLHTIIDLKSVGVAGQFRNGQDPESYRYREVGRGYRPYTTPAPSLGSYSSGDTYHGTNIHHLKLTLLNDNMTHFGRQHDPKEILPSYQT